MPRKEKEQEMMNEAIYLDVCAEYVGAAALFASKGEDAGILTKVNIIPGPFGGAIIWALDGHHAFFIYEEDGIVTEPLQISQHKELLKSCGCKVDVPKKRLQTERGLEYLRVLSRDKDGLEEWVDFTPAPGFVAREALDYKTFLEKFAETTPGIGARVINGNSYAQMRKVFKDQNLFHSAIHQRRSDDNTGPIYNTFRMVPHMLIVAMPMNLPEDENADTYTGFSEIASTLISSPYASGIKAVRGEGDNATKPSEQETQPEAA